MESWMRNSRRFQVVNGPQGKYAYHRSPSGRKVTRPLPSSIKTTSEAVRFFAAAPTPAPRRSVGIKLGKPLPHQPLDCMALSHLTGLKKIGSGRQGIIYSANRRPNYLVREIAIKVAPFDKSAERRGEKQPARVEYDIQEAVRLVAAGGVVSSMSFHTCTDFVPSVNMRNINSGSKNVDPHRQFVIFMELAGEGSLNKWIKTHGGKLTDGDLLRIISKVLQTLQRINKVYPEFRHNDLHLENVLMSKGEPKIADFGWARIKKMGTNPAVNTALKNGTAAKFGIGPDTDPRYDAHLFMNELRRLLSKIPKFHRTTAFLTKYIPEGFRGFNDVYTREGRLKYGVDYPNLPSIQQILRDPVLGGKGPTPTPKPKSPNRPAPKVPSPKRIFKNENFLTMSPRTFMKLTPGTRARALNIRKALKGKAPKRASPPKFNAAKPVVNAAPVARARISPRTLKSKKFENLINSLLAPPPNMNAYYRRSPSTRGAPPANNYYGRRNAARTKAMNVVLARLKAGRPAFSASPPRPKAPSPPRPKAPSPPRPKAPSPPRRSPSGIVKSAGSGRYKVVGPSGRLVYANGAALPMNFIKALAARKGVNIKGLRSKDAIARAIFNRA